MLRTVYTFRKTLIDLIFSKHFYISKKKLLFFRLYNTTTAIMTKTAKKEYAQYCRLASL